MSWRIFYTKHAQKDAKKLSTNNLKEKVEILLDILKKNPFQNPPPYEKLLGEFAGAFSRRINAQHRLVYKVLKKQKIVEVLSMWTL